MQIPGFLVEFLFLDRHPHVLAEMFSPCGHLELQTEQTELIQAFVESTLESAIPAQCSLHFLHQDAKLLSVLTGDAVVYRYGDRAFVMVRKDLKIVPIFERRFLDLGFCGEVD